ncbi:MAG: hypothetical protein K6U11_14040 [bacterium]|nr:hypothetical protein [bacterium]
MKRYRYLVLVGISGLLLICGLVFPTSLHAYYGGYGGWGLYGGLYGLGGWYGGLYGGMYGLYGLGGLYGGVGLYGLGGLYGGGLYGGYGFNLGLLALMNPYYQSSGVYMLSPLLSFDLLSDPLLGMGMLSIL